MSNLILPLDPETVHTELEHIEALVRKWREKVGNGIPGIDLPVVEAEEKLDAFLRQLTAELILVGGKCQNLAMVLSER